MPIGLVIAGVVSIAFIVVVFVKVVAGVADSGNRAPKQPEIDRSQK